jgi:hypothetical protein
MVRTAVPCDAFKKGVTPIDVVIRELSLGPHLYVH